MEEKMKKEIWEKTEEYIKIKLQKKELICRDKVIAFIYKTVECKNKTKQIYIVLSTLLENEFDIRTSGDFEYTYACEKVCLEDGEKIVGIIPALDTDVISIEYPDGVIKEIGLSTKKRTDEECYDFLEDNIKCMIFNFFANELIKKKVKE